ncbi:MAG: DEAD/DEAH box helicase [Alphaproteobacteria bacterium]|nr:DEAD/DEAH box helicase [Alphaproteobacteria bacterium]
MYRRAYTPREYQPVITNHILDVPRCGVWAGMGLGKTAATLTAIDALTFTGDVALDRPALVVAPLRVARNTWPNEALKWEHTRDINIVPILGDEDQRRRALRNRELVYSINYENIPWLVEYYLGQNKAWPYKLIVSDESTRLKGFRLKQGTQRARALARIAHSQCDRFIELTGTPAPNGLQDLWGQSWFLDGGERLGRTHDAFKQRWFQRSHTGFGIDPLPFAQEQIEDKLRDIVISLNAADYFDIKEPLINIVTVDIPKNVRPLYDDMEKRMFAEIEGHEVEAFNAAARTNKCLQLANGAAYVTEGGKDWVEVHDAKIEALESIVEEAAGMPVMVAYNFKSDLARLKKHFPKGVDLSTASGFDKFCKGEAPLGFAHPASMGHGVDGLQYATNILAFFGVNWDLELHDQIIERIGPVRQIQAGFNRPVFLHYVLARDTTDFMVKERLIGKRAVQDILLEAMKHRRR